MRKSVLSILLLVTVTTYAKSQAALLVLLFGEKAATENFHFAIEGGVNISNLTDLNGKTMLGPHFGLGTYIKINEKWAFVPEFKPLTKRGEKGFESFLPLQPELEAELEELDSRLILNYIDIPLLVRYEVTDRFFVGAGPQISFRTQAILKTEATVISDQSFIEFDKNLKDQTEWYDFSFPVEVGYHMINSRGGKGIDLKARWTPGFVNIAKELNTDKLLNNYFQVIVSFPFIESEGN